MFNYIKYSEPKYVQTNVKFAPILSKFIDISIFIKQTVKKHYTTFPLTQSQKQIKN